MKVLLDVVSMIGDVGLFGLKLLLFRLFFMSFLVRLLLRVVVEV